MPSKNTIAITLLLVLILPAFVVSSYLEARKYQIRKEVKHEIKAGLDEDDLVLIESNLNDTSSKMSWEHSKEFEYRGEMYDVVIREVSGNQVQYWCWHDGEETDLNIKLKSLAELMFNSDNQSKKGNEHFWSFCKQLYCQEKGTVQVEITEYGDKEFPNHNLLFQSIFKLLESPPPQFC